MAMLGRCMHRCLAIKGLNRQLMAQSLRLYSQTYYEVLGVQREASSKQIQEAFLEKSKQLHPDKKLHDGEQHDKFVKLNEAYTCLSKEETRSEYDATLPTMETLHRMEMDEGGDGRRVGKKGLARVPGKTWWMMTYTSCIVAILFGCFYMITLDMYKGREQELFLLFKSPESLDEGEEELDAA